jgi:hypothetical protein
MNKNQLIIKVRYLPSCDRYEVIDWDGNNYRGLIAAQLIKMSAEYKHLVFYLREENHIHFITSVIDLGEFPSHELSKQEVCTAYRYADTAAIQLDPTVYDI